MKQLKQLFAAMLVVAVVLVVYLLIHRDDGVDPTPDFPPGLSQEERVEMVQKHWRRMKKLSLDSSGATNFNRKVSAGEKFKFDYVATGQVSRETHQLVLLFENKLL